MCFWKFKDIVSLGGFVWCIITNLVKAWKLYLAWVLVLVLESLVFVLFTVMNLACSCEDEDRHLSIVWADLVFVFHLVLFVYYWKYVLFSLFFFYVQMESV